MQSKLIRSDIIGSGLAGKAIAKALAVLKVTDSELNLADVRFVPRGKALARPDNAERAVLCIANPSGLHTPLVLEALKEKYDLVVCEKPTSVDALQLEKLRGVSNKVAVLHVYRQLWGIQQLKKMIGDDAFGGIASIEGRLWQASRVAHYSPTPVVSTRREWVNDKTLTGAYGVSLGLGTHWLDAMQFLVGNADPLKLQHYTIRNLQDGSGDDDTYVHIALLSSSHIHVSGSISNMMHGARNDFEVAVIGEKASAQWSLMNPDEIVFGQGRERRIIYRSNNALGSNHPPFHGVGWLEGYIEILRQSYRDMLGMPHDGYPTLAESNRVMETLLQLIMRKTARN